MFDAVAKEAALRAESETWDTTAPIDAAEGDIPVIDVSAYFTDGDAEEREDVAAKLRHACETVGFWQMVGHGLDPSDTAAAFEAVRKFHEIPVEVKEQIQMDRDSWPLGGVGYMPIGARKLPRRTLGNVNEAFIMKSDGEITSDDNQWLPEHDAPGFRATVERFGQQLEDTALQLLPIYAAALGVEDNYFAPGFANPFWRLRMTHYPPTTSTASADDADDSASGAFGIAPHVDTTFFTLLLQDSPGLTVYHTPTDRWIRVPVVDNAFVVNSGELLRQWSNDRFLSVRHFANVEHDSPSRYSIPFFFNAARDYPMECISTCASEENPARYPTISYNQSQAVVQGE